MTIQLGIDVKRTDQTVRGSIYLPYGKKSENVICFFGNDEKEIE